MIEENKKNIYLILMAAVFVVSLPLFFPGIEGHFGQDLGFHINRIEGIYVALRAGEFPVKMESYWMNGYGYPVSVYYGDLLLYFPAVLRMLGISVVGAYKIYVFVINAFTLVTAYILAKKITGNMRIAVCAAIVYAFSYYRLVNVYIRAAVGEYSAMIFFPVIALAMYRMYTDTEKEIAQNAFLLATGMAGVISTHLLSAEMTTIMIACVAVLLLKKSLTKTIILTYMLAILETILFSLYFLVPFLDCYRNVMVNINGVTEKSREIQNAGVSIRKLLSFFEIPYGNVDWKEQIGLNIGPVLMFSLCIALGLCLFHRIHKRELLVMSMLVVTLVLSTKYFPWDKIRTIRFIGNVLTQIQFPWRYLGYASLFGVVLFIFLMQRVSKKRLPLTVGAVLLVSLFMMLYFTKDYNAYAEYKTFKTTQDLDSSDMGFCEYLRVGTDRDEFTGEIKKTDKVESAEIVDRSGNTMVAAIDTNEGGYVELPVINYKGYQCRDENGQILTTTDGNNNLIRVTFAEEYHGKIYIAYVQPLSWILAEWISFVGYVLVLFWRICSVRKAGKQKIKYTSEQVI